MFDIRWSVGLETAGDEVMTPEQIVELADAVAAKNGIATGMFTASYGARLVVYAETRERAIEKATFFFREAAKKAGLPEWPIVRTEAESEEEGDP
ncbi:MAG: hypothetical protein ACRDJG_08820 [Actinomycetota bacterium]